MSKKTEGYKFTERYYKINKKLTLIDGMFDHNPFFDEVRVTRASMWVLHNKKQVVSKIYRTLRQPGMPKMGYGVTPEDIYTYILDFYLTTPDKDFQVNYYGEDSGYRIAQYVLSNVKYLIQGFTNKDDLSVAKVGVIHSIISDTDEYDGGRYTVRASYTKGVEDNYERVNQDYHMECFEYLMSLSTSVWSMYTLTAEEIFYFYFHPVLGMEQDEYLNLVKKSIKEYRKMLHLMSEDEELLVDIRTMVTELAGAVSQGDFGVQQLEGVEWDL